MGRTYKLIKNGKFSDEKEFDVNVAGYMYLGVIMRALGLPVTHSFNCYSAPHEITGEDAEKIRKALNFHGMGESYLKQRVMFAISMIEDRAQYSTGTIEEDADWVMEFLKMALNPEGFASDYCEEYHHETI